MLDTEPARPLLFEGADVGGLRQDRVLLLEQVADRVQVLGEDVVLHQRPGEGPRGGLGGHQKGPLNSMDARSARSGGSQPVGEPATRSWAAAAMVRALG